VSGDGDVTVVWVAPDASRPRADAVHALAEWARARGVVLLPASESRGARTLTVDPAVGDRVEKEIDRARDAIAALDADAAERALARADALLRDHPELPHAAWLRAEVHRVWAARYARITPRDDARAEAAWQEADALDGGRVAGVGEVTFAPRRRVGVTITLTGAAGRAVVARLDGIEVAGMPAPDGATAYAVDVPAAEHHFAVALDGQDVFASWLGIPDHAPSAPRLTIPVNVGDAGACAASSFGRVARDPGGSRIQASGVSCERWLAAVPGERRDSVLVARCERDACGPLLEWRTGSSAITAAGGDVVVPSNAWPAWATWTVGGVGVAAAVVITLVATGALEARPVEPRFVAGGVRVE